MSEATESAALIKDIHAELAKFRGREEALRGVTRYSLYDVMRYRTDLWIHSRRTAWITSDLLPKVRAALGEALDPVKTIVLALVHDDAEIVFGDIQAGNKARMSKGELSAVASAEREAIDVLAERFPKMIAGYHYRDLLIEAMKKSSPEAIIMDWADKCDAYCEALHELLGGNTRFATHVVNEYGLIDLPTEHYRKYFQKFFEQHASLRPLFKLPNPWFRLHEFPEPLTAAEQGQPHTEESLQLSKNCAPYERWLFLTKKYGTDEDRKHLWWPRERRKSEGIEID